MADPVIVPPPPTITQPHSSDTSPGLDVVQKAFDKVLPPAKGAPSPESASPQPPAPPEQPSPPSAPPEPKPQPRPEEADAPSFLEQALRSEEPKPPQPRQEDEWPEELPEFKNSEEAKERYKKWRNAHKQLRDERDQLKARPPQTDPEAKKRIEHLEAREKQYQEVLSRYGVEQSAEFQQGILRPLYAAWNEAARIVHESGANPQELAHAMTLQGKAQFEALDELFENMPESARSEVHDALRTYRRYEEARQSVMANAPRTLETIRQREAERQMADLNRQREDLKNVFENAMKTLRDDAKLEVLLRTDMPEGSWWNEQAERIVKQARDLYLENTDMNRVAMACLLAPAAEVYRKLWMNSQKKIGQMQKVINERLGNEPNLTESGGSQRMPTTEAQFKDDLKKPFHEVFLREFHRSQGQHR